MATETGAGRKRSWAERSRRWIGLATIVAALACIVVFGFALANVTMRLQRHNTAREQWKNDRGKMGMAYGSLATAAAGNDALGYGLLLQIALDDVNSLESDSSAMPSKGVQQRTEFVKQAQGCLANTISAFNAQTPAARAGCGQVMLTTQ
jgi:hypothetical protein